MVMAASSISYRGRNLRTGRSVRKRTDSEDEFVINLDWAKPPSENLQEILYHITRKEVSKSHVLAYLNCFTKFCTKVTIISSDTCGLSLDEIFCCLRVSLFHEASEVRAAGLRAIRYLLRDEQSVESLNRVNLPLLICRSIDIVLDNRAERIQAVRLVRQLLSLDAKHFSPAITYCLVAIAKDGTQERDMLSRACWATLIELTLMNPTNCAQAGGIGAIINCVLQGNQAHNICEALLGVILYLLNSPSTRHLLKADLDLEYFVAPFTDLHGFGGEFCDNLEARDLRYNTSKNAMLSLLRSWPGIIYMCRNNSVSGSARNEWSEWDKNMISCDIPNGIESLISMLHLPYTDIQRFIMDMIFELFYLRIPEWTSDFETALISADPSTMQPHWTMFDGFVAAEGEAILPHLAKNRLNLMKNYLALVLSALVTNFGLLDALVSVILNSNDDCCSITATILLGELLHLSSCLLPTDFAHQYQSLPSLMAASTSHSREQRKLANSTISALNRIHALKKREPIPCSLYLDQLLQFCNNASVQVTANNIDNAFTKNKLRNCLRRENDDSLVIQAIKDSQVIGREYQSWDWDLVDCILKWPGDSLRKIEDNHYHKAFVKRLLVFYKPTSKMFSTVGHYDEHARLMCIVGQHFLDFLMEAEESKAIEHIDDFINDLEICLAQIAIENPPANSILNPGLMLSNVSHTYFLFIGRLSSSNKGRKYMEKTGIYQYLMDLINLSTHDVFMKLIVSSLDYTKDISFCRALLAKVLTCQLEGSRLYATKYLRVLLRAGVSDFRKWAIELLVQQLYDKSSAVTLAAADILDEACDCDENLETLVALRPSLLQMGDKGMLILIRYLSIPSGFKYLKDANYLEYEITRWKSTYLLKYVKIVENVLNESFTNHQRSDDGAYGRRSDKTRMNSKPKNAFTPPHLYGELAKTTEGYNLLLSQDLLSSLYQTIRSPNTNSSLGVIELKAALWAIGHVGATPAGFQLISETEELISLIVKYAEESTILSIRGTCFYILGLLGTTREGAEELKKLGWDVITHDHHEKFPLVKDNVEISNENSMLDAYFEIGNRRYNWSISSTATRLPDFNDVLSGKDWDLTRNGSFTEDFEDNSLFSMSLGTYELERLKHKKISLPNPQGFIPLSRNLPRVASLSPQHYRSIIDSRPRSSSDIIAGQIRESSVQKQNGFTIEESDYEGSGDFGISMRKLIEVGDSEVDATSVTLKNEVKKRCDSGFVAGFTPKLTNINLTPPIQHQSQPKRKISDPTSGQYFRATKDERSESIESSRTSSLSTGKSRSNSLAESTSGVSASSGDSTLASTPHRAKSNNLSPIASVSSIPNSINQNSQSRSLNRSLQFSKSMASSGNQSPALRHGYSSFIVTQRGEQVSPTADIIPSATDALGYATLRDIQKQRVSSFAHYSFDSTENQTLTEKRRDSKSNNNLDNRRVSGDSDSTVKSRRSSTVDSQFSDDSTTPERCYMGLALPSNLSLIFNVPIDQRSRRSTSSGKSSFNSTNSFIEEHEWRTHLDRLSSSQLIVNNGLDLHNCYNCLVCFKNVEKTLKNIDISVSITDTDSDNAVKSNINPIDMISPNLSKLQIDVDQLSSSFASSGGSCHNEIAPNAYSNEYSNVPNYILNRREILRFVTNLCGSVHAKQAEQGLLNLKQKCPTAFEDICLYSEVCLQMATYNFRLSARRFLQELFLDVNFDSIYTEARGFMSKLSGFVLTVSTPSSISSSTSSTSKKSPLDIENPRESRSS